MSTQVAVQYEEFADKALAGEALMREEALAVLTAPDEHLEALLQAAYRVRYRYHGNKVKLCILLNARSGLCPEDCHYCSQSKLSTAPIQKYRLMPQEAIAQSARQAVEAGARRFCIVTAGRGPTDEDIVHLSAAARQIKQAHPGLELCVSLGLMSQAHAEALKAAGVGWVNHNLNTSERFYPQICATHTYADRVETVRHVRAAGLATCSGGIVGMGETDEDIVDLAFAVRELDIESIPVNFLYPIPGTPLGSRNDLTPEKALTCLCLFRFLNPAKEIRAAGGRERALGSKKGLALFPANSMFVEGYLTTPGQAAEQARRMIESLGFEVESVTCPQ